MATVLSICDALPAEDDVMGNATAFLSNRPGIDARHSGSTLIEHLRAVATKLQSWDARTAVSLAGLYHSVYGTASFRRQTISVAERPVVQAVIGREAEHLAYAFCLLNIRDFVAGIVSDLNSAGANPRDDARFAPGERMDLLHIFVANWLEQRPRLKPLQRSKHTDLMRRIRPLLSPLARDEIERTYEFDAAPRPRLVVTPASSGPRADEAISVMDDFVPAHLRQSLSTLMERNIWRYGWKAAATQTGHHFWHSHFAGDNGDKEASCEVELHDRPLVAPVLALWELIRGTIAIGHVPVRVYANGHTYGCDGHLHTDSRRAGHFTSIYYAHPEWDVNWGGETLFFNAAGEDVIKAVHPRPGRLVHFPGTIPHAARSPSRDCPSLRSVIVVKSFCSTAI